MCCAAAVCPRPFFAQAALGPVHGYAVHAVTLDAASKNLELVALGDVPGSSGNALPGEASYSSSTTGSPALPDPEIAEPETSAETRAAASMRMSDAVAARNARDLNAVPSIGGSFGQTVGNLRIYVFAQDRTEEIASALYLHPSGHFLWMRFDYMMQAIPVFALHQPKYYNYDSIALTAARRTAFGVGIMPVGERVIFNPHMKLQVSMYSNGGITYFTRRILSEGATRLNIELQFGMTFQYPVTKNSSILTGYAINHLSNGNIHDKNPGLDTNLVYVQYLYHLHKKKPPKK